MNDRLKELYQLPKEISEGELSLQGLKEQCMDMEYRVRDILGKLSTEDRQIVELYLEMRDELEFQSVKTALRTGKKLGGPKDKSIN